jgi:chemotaxis protein MotB
VKKINYLCIIAIFFSSLFFFYNAHTQPVYRTIKKSNIPKSNINELSSLEYEMMVFGKKADMMLQKIDELVREVEFLRAKNNEYVKLSATKENEIYNLQVKLREVEDAHVDITKAISDYSSQIGSLKLESADKDKELEAKAAELTEKDKNEQSKIKALKDEILIVQKKAESDLSAKDKVISQKESEIEVLQVKYQASEKENQKNTNVLTKLRQDLDTREKELSVLKKQLGKQKDAFGQERAELKGQVKEASSAIKSLKRAVSKYKKENNVYLKTVGNLKRRLATRKKERASLQKKLYAQKRRSSRTKGEDAKDIAREALSADYNKLQKEIDESRQKIKELEEQLSAKDSALLMLKNQATGGKGKSFAASAGSMKKVIAVKDARLAELQSELDKFRSGSSGHVKTVKEMQKKLKSREDELFALQKKFLAIKHEFASIKIDKNINVESVRGKDKQIDKLKKQLKISQSRFERAVLDYKKKIERTESKLIVAKKALTQKVSSSENVYSGARSVSEKEKELRFLHNKLQRARLSHQELSIELRKQKDKYEKQITAIRNQLQSSKDKEADLEEDIKNEPLSKIKPSDKKEPPLTTNNEELEKLNMALNDSFKDDIKNHRMKIDKVKDSIVISVFADVLFDSGDDEVRFSSVPLLNKIGSIFNEQASDYRVVIEGHTDNQPIRFSEWKSNWELSSARALSVLHYFINESGIDSSRLSMTGFGEFKPIASNETEFGRQKNRRVEIILTP